MKQTANCSELPIKTLFSCSLALSVKEAQRPSDLLNNIGNTHRPPGWLGVSQDSGSEFKVDDLLSLLDIGSVCLTLLSVSHPAARVQDRTSFIKL